MTTNDNTQQTEQEAEDLSYVADVADIEEGERVIAEIEGREIAVFNLDGEFHALSNYCIHQGGPACEGLISGSVDVNEEMELTYNCDDMVVSCPWHGWEFEIESGNHLAPTDYRLPTYEVTVRDEKVYLATY